MTVDKRHEIRDFLVTRRARITPEDAGLPTFGGERRVPGLRREEVAMLAGVSADYYIRLERGGLGGASDSVVEAIARALQLDDAERTHLLDLARAIPSSRARRVPARPASTVRSSVQRVLDGMDLPATVRNTRLDLVAANELGRALYAPHFDTAGTANIARFIFLDPRAREFYPDWDGACDVAASMLRIEAGRNPLDTELTTLIDDLSTRSREFRRLWARHDVHQHRTGAKHFHHPVVGELHLVFDTFEFPADHNLAVDTFTAEPGTATEDALELLRAWAATHRRENSSPAAAGAASQDRAPRGRES